MSNDEIIKFAKKFVADNYVPKNVELTYTDVVAIGIGCAIGVVVTTLFENRRTRKKVRELEEEIKKLH